MNRTKNLFEKYVIATNIDCILIVKFRRNNLFYVPKCFNRWCDQYQCVKRKWKAESGTRENGLVHENKSIYFNYSLMNEITGMLTSLPHIGVSEGKTQPIMHR